jgi:hypothetical protein
MLTSQLRRIVLTVHVLATVGLFGADLVLLTLGISGASGSDPRTVYPAAHLVGAWVVAPLATIALVSGLTLGTFTRWGLVKHWWIAIKLAITAVLTTLVYLVLLPKLGSVAGAAHSSSAGLVETSDRTLLAIIPAAGSALLALNVVLAIYKPRRRLLDSDSETASVAI